MAASAMVEAGTVRPAVRTDGPADGHPVLLLHGLGSTSAVWERFAARLVADGRRVLAVDLRGHGESSWPGAGLRLRHDGR